MKKTVCLLVVVSSFIAAQTIFAFPGVVDANKMADTVGDTAVSITNSVSGGVTSKEGKVTADGRVLGKANVISEGKNATATAKVGSNSGVTAKGDISATGVVNGDLTVKASGENSTAELAVGSNGR